LRDYTIDGIININKPLGKTSFQVVSRVRGLSRERKVGHSGTLDPRATGVLPILLGRATRLQEFLTEAKKVYQAQIELGSATTTYDASGIVTQKGEVPPLTKEQIEAALDSFRGSIAQIPPMYSAVKYHGKPLYHLARAGVEVPRKPRQVEISRLEILDWQSPSLTIEVECGKGTYIRSLAHDLGQALGCGAHLMNLVRQQSGPFHIDEAISLTRLEDAFQHGYWEEFINPLDTVLFHLPAITVDEATEQAITHGHALPLAEGNGGIAGERCRAYSLDGRLLALLRFKPENGLWQPEKVFS